MTQPIVVDTSVLVNHLRQHVTREVAELRDRGRAGEVIIGDLVIHELLRGVRDARQAREIEEELNGFAKVDMVNHHIARMAAGQYRELRRRGITVRSAIDCLIAAYCIETATPLLHSDRDFAHFEREFGLQVVQS